MPTVTRIEPTKSEGLIQKLRCAAYCRVSSNSEDQLHSYAAQLRYYREKINGSETEELADIYADEGITGTCENKRNEFKRLIKDCKRGKIDRIYTKSISRFARNTKECLKNLRLLKELGISVFFEKENIDTAKVSDEMMITIMGGLAQEESTSISKNLRWSIQKRMKDGTYEAPSVPFGYDKINGELVVNENESEIVRNIFDRYLSGEGITKIADTLNREGIKTKSNNKWGITTILYILTNEKYTGNSILQKKYSTDTLPVRLLVNNGDRPKYYVTETHKPIISQEVFDSVRRLLNQRKKAHKKSQFKSVLTSFVKCGYCGSSYRRKRQNNKWIWICKKHDTGADLCEAKSVDEEIIKQAFIRLCNKLILHHREILLPLQRALQELNAKKFSGNTKILDIRRDMAGLKEQKHVIARLRTKGFLDEQKYNEQLTALDSKFSRLERELNKLSRADDEDETLEHLDILIDCIEQKSVMTDFDEELFGTVVEKIIVRNKTLEFNLISGMKLKENFETPT